ncbi:MAG: threonine/serine dehydratase [Candidatus Saccharibacteria bacterium]
MPELNPPHYHELRPFHERLPRQLREWAPIAPAMTPVEDEVYPDIPDDLVSRADRDVTPDDWQRLHQDVPGDTMSGYRFDSAARRDILAIEKAAQRLGVAGVPTLGSYALAVLRAQQAMAGVVVRTDFSPYTSTSGGRRLTVDMKHDADQPIGAFKLRGAYNVMRQLSDEQRAGGVIAASAGNHAQGVAYSARLLDTPATLVMPTTTARVKVAAVEAYGAHVILAGTTFEAASRYCRQLLHERPHLFAIDPFDDEQIMIGQATLAAELLQQNPDFTHLFVPVGGGGLYAGVATYLHEVRPDVRVIGVEPQGANGMTRSLQAAIYTPSPRLETIAEGAAAQPGHRTLEALQRVVTAESMVNVSDMAIARAVVELHQNGLPTEATGAIALAGLWQYIKEHDSSDKFAVLRTGKNIDASKLKYLYELAGVQQIDRLRLVV